MVLENRLGITDSAELARTEEKIQAKGTDTVLKQVFPDIDTRHI